MCLMSGVINCRSACPLAYMRAPVIAVFILLRRGKKAAGSYCFLEGTADTG